MPRVWGKEYNSNGDYTWKKIETVSYENFEYGYVTNLIQALKLNVGESPFYANVGIPAQKSVATQIFPDFFVIQTQQLFAPYFATLLIAKVESLTPTYNIDITFYSGEKFNTQVLV